MNTGVLDILSALGDSGANPALTEISKALTTMGQGTDLSALTGGGAFRVENMDPILASATVRQEHFKFFKRLLPNRRTSWSVLDQAVVKTDIGAFFGSANSDEIGTNQQERQGTYDRMITQLGTYFSRRSVSIITAIQATLQNRQGVVDFSAVDEEDVNAALEILYSLEHDLFNGDNAINPNGTSGIITAIEAAGSNVVDMAGQPLNSHVPLSTLAGNITDLGNWGKPSLVFMSGKVKSDMDAKLEVGYRVNLDSGVGQVQTGVLVRGMKYSTVAAADGMLDFDPSAFLNEQKQAVGATKPQLCTGAVPQSVTATVSGGADADSAWLDNSATSSTYTYTVAGSYSYLVEAYSVGNVSLPVASAAVTMVAGHSISLSILASTSNAETYYKIYRSRKNGTSTPSDYRYVGSVKKNPSGTTVWVDENKLLPGSSKAVMLTMDPASLRWIQMLPMTKIPFALNDLSYKWGAFVVGALRVSLPQHHGVVKNIIPTSAQWWPF